jgi:signal transduction histidine kinase
MNFYAASALINAIVSFVLGVFVFSKNKKGKANISFALFALSIVCWSIPYYLWQISDSSAGALLYTRLLMIGAIFIPVTYLYFVLTFLEILKEQKRFLTLSYLLFFVFFLSDATPLFVDHIEQMLNFKYWPIPGLAFHIFLPLWILYAVYSIYLLLHRYQHSKGAIKYQIKYITIGTIIGYVGGLTNYLLWYRIPIPPVGNISASIYLLFVAYAIIRYRFMDIRIVVRKFFIYLCGVLFVFAFLTFFLLFFSVNINKGILYLYILLAAIIFTAGFHYLESLLVKIANKYFFAGLYNYQETIKKLSKELTYNNDLSEILDSIVGTIEETMRLDRVGVLLIDESRNPGVFKITKLLGFNEKDSVGLVRDKFFVKRLEKNKQPIVADELPFLAGVAKTNLEKKGLDNILINMNRLGASLCLPLINKNKLFGIIVLGAKFSGGSYSSEDLELLSTLADQAGIAVNNAQLYQQVKDFNLVLESKVNAQTRELKKEAAELEKKNINLKKLLEVKGEFLRLVNHQLNTPLSIIKNAVYMMNNKNFDTQKAVLFINEGVRRIEGVINEFWRAFAVEGEGIKLNLVKTDIVALVEKMADDAGKLPAFKSKNLEIKIFYSGKVPEVKSDPVQISQVISNLLDNAIAYTPAGSISFSLTDNKDGMVKVAIADTGNGMSVKDKNNIFEKFYRGDKAKQSRPGGSGLGLYIGKKIIEAHGGELKLEKSEPGKGTTFSFTLPIWK